MSIRGYRPWLAATAVAYSLFHHTGTGLTGLGSVGVTRWADWVDLLTPHAVLLPAAVVLRLAGAGGRTWLLFAVGALAYTEGHGIHLAANSIGNVAPGDAAHLWDEVVGHYLWYAGVAAVFAALALCLAGRERPGGAVPYLLALLVGLTFATNALEGGTAWLGILVSAGFAWWGLVTRERLGRMLLVAYGPSELGW